MARRLDPTAGTSVTHTYFHKREYLWCLETCGDGIGYADALALDGLGQTAEAIQRTEDRLASVHSSPLGVVLLSSMLAALKGDGALATATAEEAFRRFWLGPEEKYYFARHVIRAGDVGWGMTVLDGAVRGGYYLADALAEDPWFERARDLGAFRQLREFARGARERARNTFVACGGESLLG